MTVTDAVEFDSPQEFEHGADYVRPVEAVGGESVAGGRRLGHVVVEIATEGNAFQITPEEIHEQTRNGRTPTRLGVELEKPVARATIIQTITP